MLVVGDSGVTGFTITYALLVGVMFWKIYKMNRSAVSRRLRPERDELARLLKQVGE